MKRSLYGVLAVAFLVAVAALLLPATGAIAARGLNERWVNTNHLQVRVGGRWEDVPLVPMSDSACRSGDSLLERYCE